MRDQLIEVVELSLHVFVMVNLDCRPPAVYHTWQTGTDRGTLNVETSTANITIVLQRQTEFN